MEAHFFRMIRKFNNHIASMRIFTFPSIYSGHTFMFDLNSECVCMLISIRHEIVLKKNLCDVIKIQGNVELKLPDIKIQSLSFLYATFKIRNRQFIQNGTKNYNNVMPL